MAKSYTYIQGNTTFSDVKRIGLSMGGYPFGLKDNYVIVDNTVSQVKHSVFNAIDIDWNGALLPNWGEEYAVSGLHTSGELLTLINSIPESISGINVELDNKVDVDNIESFIEASLSGIIGDTMANYETTESVLSRLSSYVTKTSLSNTLYDYVTKSYLFQNFSQEGGKSAYQLYLEENGLTEEDISLSDWLNSLKGERGYPGAQGDNGKSAYEIAKENGYTGTEEEWLASLIGPRGEAGQGTIISTKTYLTLEELEQDHPAGDANYAYIVNGDLYVWGFDEAEQKYKWTYICKFRGENGYMGSDGESFYQTDLRNNVDYYLANIPGVESIDDITEEVWLNYIKENVLKGAPGERGEDGRGLYINGAYETLEDLILEHPQPKTQDEVYLVNGFLTNWNGSEWIISTYKITGEKGDTGYSAYEIAVKNGYEGTEEEWLESLKAEALDSEEVERILSKWIENHSTDISITGTNDLLSVTKTTNTSTSGTISQDFIIELSNKLITDDSLSGSVNDIIEQWKSTQNLVTSEDISGLVTTTDLVNYVSNDSLSGSVNDILNEWIVDKEYIDETKFNELLNNISSINSITGSNDLINITETNTTVSGIKYKDYELSLSNKIITNDNISGILASWANDSELITSNSLTGILANYIKNDELQISGSSNIIINKNDNIYNISTTGLAEKISLDQLTQRVDDLILESGSGEMNTINSISVNGYTQEIDQNKNVNIIMPTKLSDLQNDVYIWHTI